MSAHVISATGSLTGVTGTYGTASASENFSVSGTNMTAGILVTPPAGFEVSKDNTTFASTVTIGAAGTIASTPVYVRLVADDPAGVRSGNIVLSSTGATSINVATGSSTVNKAALKVTADNQSSTYGQALPALTVSYTGFTNGDNHASLTTAATASTTATAASPAGCLATINASGAVDPNYTITYTAGTLTISKAPLTITANNQSSNQGQAIPALTVSYNGFTNGDTQASLTTAATASTMATASSPVGMYPITASGAIDPNYTISYVAGTLTINPALPVLTVTALNQNTIYGQALPALTVSYSGFVNGDTQASLTTAPTASIMATAASPAGTYPITAAGAVDPNYTIKYVAGTLTIGKAPLTITALNQTATHGQPLPALTVSYNGFTNGDTQASLTTLPTAGTTATPSSPVGNYAITASGGVDPNYAITYMPGTLTMTIGFSYSNPQTYTAGTAITALTPASSGVAAPGYNSTPATIGSGFSDPYGVAVDAAGNVYIAQELGGTVTEIPVGGASPFVIGSGFSAPYGVASDAAGNVYVADPGNSTIKKIPLGGGTPITLGSGFVTPLGVAVDAAGNVYIADAGNNLVKEIPVGSNTPITIGGVVFSSPSAIAVDAAGNVYVADAGNNQLKKIPVSSNTTQVILASGLNNPQGIAVDAAGNVYVGNRGSNVVQMLPAGSSSLVTIGSGFSIPVGVAVDGAGNVFVGVLQNDAVKKINPVGGYYITPFLPAGLSFNSTTGVISGTATVGSPAANYSVTAYNGTASSTATLNIKVNALTISYSGPKTYTAGTAITALSPAGSGVAAIGNVRVNEVSVGSGFNGPEGVATDAAGNIYVAEAGTNTIKKIPVGSGIPVIIATGFNLPTGITVDASGNVYVADAGNNAVKKVPFTGGVYGTPVALGSGFSNPQSVAVDAAGNVFVSDLGHLAIKKVPAGSNTPATYAIAFSSPGQIAFDAAGNLFVSDPGSGNLFRIPAGGGDPVSFSSIAKPAGLAIDAAGDVYVTDQGTDALYRVPAAGGIANVVVSGFSLPVGVAMDGAGNIYMADNVSGSVSKIAPAGGYFISPALPAGLSFNSSTGAISGTPTASSPATIYTITAYNTFGSNLATLSIAVNLPALPTISYSSPQAYAISTTIPALATLQSSGVYAPVIWQLRYDNGGIGLHYPLWCWGRQHW